MSNQRNLAIVLMLSLMLNTFCIGAIVSDWHRQTDHPFTSASRWGKPLAEQSQLSDHAREMMQQLRQQRRSAMRDQFSAIQNAREAVRIAFVAEPFDEAALNAAFSDLRAAESELSARAQADIAKLASNINLSERTLLAERITQRASRLRIKGMGGRPLPSAPPDQ